MERTKIRTFIVVGLGFGDEGKGTVVDFLTREHSAHTVVRFNGGAQAAHNVVTPEGKHHTFAQFGSGTLAGARTHLSRFMLVNPFDLENELRGLVKLGVSDALSRLTISPDALVTTPLHIVANQMKEEQRSGLKHGTCGKGIGETQEIGTLFGEDAIRVRDLHKAGVVEGKLSRLSEHYIRTLSEAFAKEHGEPIKIAKSYQKFIDQVNIRDDTLIWDLQRANKTLIFEGAQGILLDQDVGFHPHTTWSKTTSHNALELLPGDSDPTIVGVTRAYSTRHGVGPFMVGGFDPPFPEAHNANVGWQGAFVYGAWDAIALDYASKCDEIHEVAVTCLDHTIGQSWKSIWSYEYAGDLPDLSPYFWAEGRRIFQITPGSDRAHVEAITNRLWHCTPNIITHADVTWEYIIDAIGEVLHAPVTIQSFGPTYKDKKIQVLAWR